MIIEEVAKKLKIDPEKLLRESLLKWFEDELAKTNAEIAELLIKYKVNSPSELEVKIKKGQVPEHPAWEDLIILEELIETKKRLEEGLAIVQKS
ncbi:MAG: hypothetical protein ACTSYM_00685 [Candidatus Baldrarchaeia archaeon]